MAPTAHARYLTPIEYAQLMRVSPSTVRRMCARGEIEGAERIGRQWRIPNPDFRGAAK